jgi:hypothetical protein
VRRVLAAAAAGGVALAAAVAVVDDQGSSSPDPRRVGVEGWADVGDLPLSPRTTPVLAWTGSELLVVGGERPGSREIEAVRDGAAFDPRAGAWREIAEQPVEPLYGAGGVWTGEELVVVGIRCRGGVDDYVDCDPGGYAVRRYRPDRDRWEPVELPAELEELGPGDPYPGAYGFVGDEAVFGLDGRFWAFAPRSGRWRILPEPPRYQDLCVSGDRLVAVEYDDESSRSVGGLAPHEGLRAYVLGPGDRAWSAAVVPDAPVVPALVTDALCAGEGVLVAQLDPSVPTTAGFYLDVAARRWRPAAPAPNRFLPGAPHVWTGRELIVWSQPGPPFEAFGRDPVAYHPIGDRWRPLPAVEGAHEVLWADGVAVLVDPGGGLTLRAWEP